MAHDKPETIDARAERTVDELLNLCNYFGGSKALMTVLRSRLEQGHRTILQSFMSVLRTAIWHYSKCCQSQNFDARNKDSVLWANRVRCLDAEKGDEEGPFIFI